MPTPEEHLTRAIRKTKMAKESIGKLRAQIAELTASLATCTGDRTALEAEISRLTDDLAGAKAALDDCRAGEEPEPEPTPEEPEPTPEEPEPTPEEPEPTPGTGVEPSGIPAVDAGPVLFFEDFEQNDFRKWSTLAPAGDPDWNGSGGGGAIHGCGGIVTGFSRSGRRCYKMEVDPAKVGTYKSTPSGSKAGCANWARFRKVPEGWTSVARYFIPESFPAAFRSLIWQIKSSGEGNVSPDGAGFAPLGIHLVAGNDFGLAERTLHLNSSIGDLNGKTIAGSKTVAPKGRWFDLACRVELAKWPSNGRVEAWFKDGGAWEKIFDVVTPTTDGDYGYLGLQHYAVGKEPLQRSHIFLDDVCVRKLA